MISKVPTTLPTFLLLLSPLLPGSIALGQQVTTREAKKAIVSPVRLTLSLENPLSTYRGFRFGMSLTEAVKHSGMDLSEVSVVHKRPAMIQALNWNPERFSRDPAKADPVEAVQFTFYNGKLSRAVVDYAGDKTRGMNVGDMIEALSMQYGPAVRPISVASFPSSSFSEGLLVLATWEDPSYSVNLVQSPSGEKFGLVAFSKELDHSTQQSIAAGVQMDQEQAPERQKQGKQDTEDKLNKARLENRARFRP